MHEYKLYLKNPVTKIRRNGYNKSLNHMKRNFNLLVITTIILLIGCDAEKPQFTERIIDDQAPEHLWMKSTGDVNSDGNTDMLVGGWQKGGMVVYLAPNWEKQIINDSLRISTDAEVCDIDHNGIPDVVAVVNQAVIWLSGPDWKLHVIDSIVGHDVEVFDFNSDGLTDVVARNQGEFGTTGGHTLYFYYQEPLGNWKKCQKEILDGEGLKVADVNNDQKKDIIINRYWFENTGIVEDWKEHKLTDSWNWPNTAIDFCDINSDGLPDIVYSPSELAGNRYHISWFEAPKDPSLIWKEHIIADSIETVIHSVGTADFNLDGNMDIIIAEMQQGADPDEVAIFYNNGKDNWEKQVISTGGSHSMRLCDFDGDGDMDIFGANFAEHVVKMWVNEKRH
jgi:hypothetical protein